MSEREMTVAVLMVGVLSVLGIAGVLGVLDDPDPHGGKGVSVITEEEKD